MSLLSGLWFRLCGVRVMKTVNVAIAMIIAIAIAPAMASGGSEPNIREVCGSYSEMARTIMTERQRGVSMREMMDRADGREPHQTMVIQAYDEIGYSTSQVQQRTINKFADGWYLDCARYLETK